MKNNNLSLKSSNRNNYNHNNQMKRKPIQRNLYLRQELGLSINPTEYVKSIESKNIENCYEDYEVEINTDPEKKIQANPNTFKGNKVKKIEEKIEKMKKNYI
ncbi:hypothetical protein M153_6261000120 [Pseudoloma neurophilia]|uniref:Uncharacterized protein n=1 Tax=Pseudoloma neurophilia TaxID=146866 RepID=A0A0R0M220_9MICR|nr:hypothetical protein M153_6261000120 [Pseudoloma neurophilia]